MFCNCLFEQAILKIIKHCKEFSPALVTGQLLGLDVGSVLEVTNCFPFPVRYFFSGQLLELCRELPLFSVSCLLNSYVSMICTKLNPIHSDSGRGRGD